MSTPTDLSQWTDRIREWVPRRVNKQHGGGRRVFCPVHQERTPSCHVRPDGWAHCYGCGWQGRYEDAQSSPDGLSAVVTENRGTE